MYMYLQILTIISIFCSIIYLAYYNQTKSIVVHLLILSLLFALIPVILSIFINSMLISINHKSKRLNRKIKTICVLNEKFSRICKGWNLSPNIQPYFPSDKFDMELFHRYTNISIQNNRKMIISTLHCIEESSSKYLGVNPYRIDPLISSKNLYLLSESVLVDKNDAFNKYIINSIKKFVNKEYDSSEKIYEGKEKFNFLISLIEFIYRINHLLDHKSREFDKENRAYMNINSADEKKCTYTQSNHKDNEILKSVLNIQIELASVRSRFETALYRVWLTELILHSSEFFNHLQDFELIRHDTSSSSQIHINNTFKLESLLQECMQTLSGSSPQECKMYAKCMQTQDQFWPDLLIPQVSEINELYLSINQIMLNLAPEVESNNVSHQAMESYETKTKEENDDEGRLQKNHNSDTSLNLIKESKSSFESLEYKSVIYLFIY